MSIIDLRSDTVTKPSPAMRSSMHEAKVGDDVFGEDPTTNQLETMGADLFRKEAALFVPSGTQSNLIALMTHCKRGDEYIVGQNAHTYRYEGGGAAVLGSIQPQPLGFEPDGTLNLDKVSGLIKPNDFHYARTRLLCLENTQDGLALPMDYLSKTKEFANEYKLKTHLDGARVFNAAVKHGIPVHEISSHFDSISVCLSKGLGAPVGSLLCSTAEFINEARRWRKVLGGGMRQTGVLAAPCIYALENNIQRLEQDHENMAILRDNLAEIEELQVKHSPMQTNMVFLEIDKVHAAELQNHLDQKGILICSGQSIRLVTHMDISKDDIFYIIKEFKDYFKRKMA